MVRGIETHRGGCQEGAAVLSPDSLALFAEGYMQRMHRSVWELDPRMAFLDYMK
jgi:hypothetical protein